MRQSLYREATGEFSMPSALDVTSTSAGDMFLGAFLPGMVLVGVYFAYILITALLKPIWHLPCLTLTALQKRFSDG